MRTYGWALAAALVLVSGPVTAQLRGGVEQSGPAPTAAPVPKKLCQDAFASQNPLTGHPEIMPAEDGPDGKRCTPPDPSWRLVGQDGNTCCYVSPLVTPMVGAVVPIGQAGADQARGAVCTGNGFDLSGQTAVCTNPTRPLQASASQSEGGTPPSKYDYPAPRMVNPTYAGGVGGGPSSGAPAGGNKPVTFSTAKMFYGPATLSAQIPSNLDPKIKANVALEQTQPAMFVTAVVEVVRKKTDKVPGTVKFDSATETNGRVIQLNVTTQY